MKKLVNIIFVLLQTHVFSQGGQWTWMGGDTLNNLPVYGVQGVPSPLNIPAGVYEAAQWEDLQGNAWIFGGFPANASGNNLWKYDMQLLQWVWMQGNGTNPTPEVFGIKGVPSPQNWPGGISTMYSVATWTDLAGNFWLIQYDKPALWKYDVGIGQWAWMSGDTIANAPPVFGVQGVPSPLNTPGGRAEHNNCWTDNAGNLWLFGGWVYSNIYSDTWKYDVVTNEWTWMHGPNTPGQNSVYGIKGVASTLNNPGARCVHCKWKDSSGNLWLFGGSTPGFQYKNDTWRYNINTNEWTWIHGPDFTNDAGHYGAYCMVDSSNLPASRWENSACWNDTSDNFWMYAGVGISSLNDLWHFSPVTNLWTLVFGGNQAATTSVYGTIGVSSSANDPATKYGPVAWHDVNGNLWMFGGSGNAFCNDMWKFTFDTLCPALVTNQQIPDVMLQSSDTVFCSKQTINFTDLSTNNPISWNWYFPGATPDTSTQQNPTGIYYPNYGSFDVALKACNANGCDSLYLTGFINELQLPPTPVVTQNADTLFSSPAFSYQWYESNNPTIILSTLQNYITYQPGSYYVIACDSFGCCSSSVLFIITNVNDNHVSDHVFTISPNPNHGIFTISCDVPDFDKMKISVFDCVGKKVFELEEGMVQQKSEKEIDLKNCDEGVYFVKISIGEITGYGKVVVLR